MQLPSSLPQGKQFDIMAPVSFYVYIYHVITHNYNYTVVFRQALGVLINLTEHSGRNRRQLELTKIKGHGQDKDDELLRVQKNIGFHGDDSALKALMDMFLKHHRMAEAASIAVRQFYFHSLLYMCNVMSLSCTCILSFMYFLRKSPSSRQ